MYDFRANIAVLLNITPDHLDRYDYKFENYVASKFRIAQNQTADDAFIYCADDAAMKEYMKHHTFNAQSIPFSIKQTIEGNGAFLQHIFDKWELHLTHHILFLFSCNHDLIFQYLEKDFGYCQ